MTQPKDTGNMPDDHDVDGDDMADEFNDMPGYDRMEVMQTAESTFTPPPFATITVAQLIEKLQTMPQDATVWQPAQDFTGNAPMSIDGVGMSVFVDDDGNKEPCVLIRSLIDHAWVEHVLNTFSSGKNQMMGLLSAVAAGKTLH